MCLDVCRMAQEAGYRLTEEYEHMRAANAKAAHSDARSR